jgi:hypothetical protein
MFSDPVLKAYEPNVLYPSEKHKLNSLFYVAPN